MDQQTPHDELTAAHWMARSVGAAAGVAGLAAVATLLLALLVDEPVIAAFAPAVMALAFGVVLAQMK